MYFRSEVEGGNEIRFLPMKRESLDRTAGNFDGEESTFVQYMCEHLFPDALAVASGFHAGPGQVSLGKPKWRTDLCMLLNTDNTGRKRTLFFSNYHGYFHLDQNCRKDGHEKSCRKFNEVELKYNKATVEEDELMYAYAEEMSSVHPLSLKFEYQSYSPCFLFHGNPLPGCNFSSLQQQQQACKDPRKFLATTHSEKYMRGRRYKNGVSERGLVEDILNGNLQGFITIQGGKETSLDPSRLSFAFCQSRGTQDIKELGSEAERLAKERHGELGLANLQKRLKEDVTFTRQHYEGSNTVSTDYFKFLVNQRGLKEYKILHFLHYEVRKFLTPWVVSMLQNRWDIKKGLARGKNCSELVLKIILNAFYGYRLARLLFFSRLQWNDLSPYYLL